MTFEKICVYSLFYVMIGSGIYAVSRSQVQANPQIQADINQAQVQASSQIQARVKQAQAKKTTAKNNVKTFAVANTGTLTNLEKNNSFTIKSFSDSGYTQLVKTQTVAPGAMIQLSYPTAPYIQVFFADGTLVTECSIGPNAYLMASYGAFMQVDGRVIAMGLQKAITKGKARKSTIQNDIASVSSTVTAVKDTISDEIQRLQNRVVVHQ